MIAFYSLSSSTGTTCWGCDKCGGSALQGQRPGQGHQLKLPELRRPTLLCDSPETLKLKVREKHRWHPPAAAKLLPFTTTQTPSGNSQICGDGSSSGSSQMCGDASSGSSQICTDGSFSGNSQNLRRWVFYTHLKKTRIKPTKHNKTPNTCTAAQQCEDVRLMNFSRWMVCNGLLTKKLRQQEMGLEGWDATDIGTSWMYMVALDTAAAKKFESRDAAAALILLQCFYGCIKNPGFLKSFTTAMSWNTKFLLCCNHPGILWHICLDGQTLQQDLAKFIHVSEQTKTPSQYPPLFSAKEKFFKF